MSLTAKDLDTLRHMVGLNDRWAVVDESKPPWRNYFCASPGDEQMARLVALGMVERYSVSGGYEWFQCLAAGLDAARQSFKTIQPSKASRRYAKFLDLHDVNPDLTFRQFLTAPEFAEARRLP